jgi:hypothetical protein
MPNEFSRGAPYSDGDETRIHDNVAMLYNPTTIIPTDDAATFSEELVSLIKLFKKLRAVFHAEHHIRMGTRLVDSEPDTVSQNGI